MVAPHGGAWIEINVITYQSQNIIVAPHGGAWIEINGSMELSYIRQVAPHGGAWIEILNSSGWLIIKFCRSPRGSVDWNNNVNNLQFEKTKSLPTGERGLKSAVNLKNALSYSRSPRGSVDWNITIAHVLPVITSRSPRGSVDWNCYTLFHVFPSYMSLPTGERGLKCQDNLLACDILLVAPHGGAWIEISVAGYSASVASRRSPRGSVDWNTWCFVHIVISFCRSPRGSVDWNIY